MVPVPDITVVLSDNPELLVVLAVLVRLARAYQSSLTWPEYRAAHRFKRGVFPILYWFTKGKLHLINDKGGRNDKEFVTTVDMSIREAVRDLREAGGCLHLINSLKRRPDEHGDPLTSAHLIWTIPGKGEQVEAYLFRNDDGTTDVYAHTEASVDDPMAHLTAGQVDGDIHNVLPARYTTA